MSSTRSDLEAALAAGFERGADAEWRDTLAIYADHLLSEGDPRGELIALDLQIDTHGTTAELAARRASLLTAFLGHLRPLDNPHLAWVGDTFSRGFVDDFVIDEGDPNACERLAAILASAIGSYLRGITIRGDEVFIDRVLGIAARRDHPWLEQLALIKRTWTDVPVVRNATLAMVVAATPRLRRLAVAGYRVVDELLHPALRKLRVTGEAALGSLVTAGLPYVAVDELDLAFGGATPFDAPGDYRALDDDDLAEQDAPPQAPADEWFELCAERLPALRRLDLSRNEPADPRSASTRMSGGGTVFDFVGRLPMRARLTHLKLPSLRRTEDVEALQRAILEMPELVEVELGRTRELRQLELHHPVARFVFAAAMSPWPPRETLRAGQALRVAIPGARTQDIVTLDAAVSAMEWRWRALPATARSAWAIFWAFLDDLADTREAPFPMDILIHAIEACGSALDEGGWRELLEDMRDRRMSSGAHVSISHYWV
jgi:hypothetical protein